MIILPPAYIPQAPLDHQVVTQSVTATSSPALAIYPGPISKAVVVMITDQAAYINFGTRSVGPATSSHFRMEANKLYAFEFSAESTHFTILRVSADGTLKYYVPGSPPAPNVPTLPASAVEYWHSLQGLTAAGWTGQLRGTALLPVASPVIGPDGTLFRGRTVGVAGTGFWRGTGFSPLVLSGTRPYTFSIARMRAFFGIPELAFLSLGVDGGTDNHYVVNDGVAGNFKFSFPRGGPFVVGSTQDALPHIFETWADGTNLNFQIDGGAVSTAASTNSLGASVTAVGIAINAANTGGATQSTHAFHLICSSAPTPDERAALRNWAKDFWGV